MFLQISFTYTSNSSGPKTLPCGTLEATLTYLDSCPPTLTFCVRPTTNSLTQTTTLESTLEAASFISIWPHVTLPAPKIWRWPLDFWKICGPYDDDNDDDSDNNNMKHI